MASQDYFNSFEEFPRAVYAGGIGWYFIKRGVAVAKTGLQGVADFFLNNGERAYIHGQVFRDLEKYVLKEKIELDLESLAKRIIEV